MPNFKFVISDGSKSYQVEKDQKDCPVMGKKIGETVSGDFLGLSGYELQITGGSDKDGFPMRTDFEGAVRKRNILTKGIGLKAEKGLRRRRTVRGSLIAQDIVQINCKVTRKGEKPVEEVFGKKDSGEEKTGVKEEPKKEETKEAKPEEKKEVKEEAPKEPEKKEATPEAKPA